MLASLPWPADCKDKFLVQCVKLGSSDAKEVTPDMFDATKQKDIRCVQLGEEPGVVACVCNFGCHQGSIRAKTHSAGLLCTASWALGCRRTSL